MRSSIFSIRDIGMMILSALRSNPWTTKSSSWTCQYGVRASGTLVRSGHCSSVSVFDRLRPLLVFLLFTRAVCLRLGWRQIHFERINRSPLQYWTVHPAATGICDSASAVIRLFPGMWDNVKSNLNRCIRSRWICGATENVWKACLDTVR